MSGRTASPFSPRVVLAMLVVGTLVFLATLFFIGTGIGNGDLNNGKGHAASNGLTGYSALFRLLEAQGYETSMSRNRGELDESESLLVLTPELWSDPEEVDSILAARRYVGPTLIILPKWIVMKVGKNRALSSKDGWVAPLGSNSPEWVEELDELSQIELGLKESSKPTAWEGFDHAGELPAPEATQTMAAEGFVAMVEDEDGRMLAGFLDDGYYPDLSAYAGISATKDDETDEDLWPVVVVAEPDLMNNWGLADRGRAIAASDIVDAAMDGYDLPVQFDLTLNGMGASKNLLSLAFAPPFLAATLCLVLAMVAIGWRAFQRFGASRADAPSLAFGKAQLVANSARLMQRTGRLRLLGPPYAALMTQRIAKLLGLRSHADTQQTEDEILRLLRARKIDGSAFTQALLHLRSARSPTELLRAASALKSIEGKLQA